MSYGSFVMPPSSREFSRVAAIVGIGETDYRQDYQASRANAPHYAPTTEGLATIAFERALADAGLKHSDVDGLSVSFLNEGPSAAEMGVKLGLKPRYTLDATAIMAGPLPQVCAAIAAGECDTVAMIHSCPSRASGRKFGGQRDSDTSGAMPLTYYYFHPWGWSSMAAHWAFIWSHYQKEYGATEEDLGSVAIQLRKNAMANPNAIMHSPMTIEDYLASRYIVDPIHLYDMCLVNDGGVCLIVRRADRAKDMPHEPVLVAGWGEGKVKGRKMEALVRDRLRRQCQDSARQTLEMAGLALSDVGHFEGYDSSSINLINQFEGLGFVGPGEGLEFCKGGGMAVGGSLPVNVAGGMLSGSYMHGWSHIAEITRQLRHEAGDRQIADLEVSMYSLAQTDQVHPLIFARQS
jgi:acetyl-CoA acetyltransferase